MNKTAKRIIEAAAIAGGAAAIGVVSRKIRNSDFLTEDIARGRKGGTSSALKAKSRISKKSKIKAKTKRR